VERLLSTGNKTLCNLSKVIEKIGLFYQDHTSRVLLEGMNDLGLDISKRMNVSYDSVNEEYLIDPKECAVYFCYNLGPDDRLSFSRLIQTQQLLKNLEWDIQAYTMNLLNFGFRELYNDSESSNFAEMFLGALEQMMATMASGSTNFSKPLAVQLVTSKGKVLDCQETSKIFRMKDCLYFKFLYVFAKTRKALPTTIATSSRQLEYTTPLYEDYESLKTEFLTKFYSEEDDPRSDRRCTYRTFDSSKKSINRSVH